MPVFHSPDFDLVADFGAGLLRVQVKTSTVFRNGRWEIALATRGGNRSWSGLVEYLDPSRYDFLFVLVGDVGDGSFRLRRSPGEAGCVSVGRSTRRTR
jgi:hypothetical protein